MVRSSEDILEMLRRRPCCLDDICNGLAMPPNEVIKHIEILRDSGLVEAAERGGVLFYRPCPTPPIK
jgi:predicted transcriptional regulator